MTAISGALPTGAHAYGTTSSAPVAADASRSPATLAGLSQTAVALSTQNGVIASLGGASAALTYSASGLFNSMIQAGSPADSASTDDSSSSGQQVAAGLALDRNVVGTLSSASSAGIYAAVGTQAGSVDASSYWADALKSRPALAATFAADTTDQAIVAGISAFA